MRKILFFVIIFVSLLLVGCLGPKKVYYPEWYETQNSTDYYFFYGTSEVSAHEINCLEKGRSDALAYAYYQCASQIQMDLEGTQVEDTELSDVELEKSVKIVGASRIKKCIITNSEIRYYSKGDGIYKTWVQIMIDKDVLLELVTDNLL